MDMNTENANAALAAELRGEIASQGTTRKAVADATGIPYVTLQRYLAGTREWPLSAVLLVSRALEVDPGSLLDRVQSRYERMSDGETTVNGNDTKSAYGLAAKRGRKKNEIPHAE